MQIDYLHGIGPYQESSFDFTVQSIAQCESIVSFRLYVENVLDASAHLVWGTSNEIDCFCTEADQ